MSDVDVFTAERRPAKSRMLWLRILGLTALGGLLLIVISLPSFANEDPQAHPGVWWYVTLALVTAAVMSRTYVVVRRSAFSKRRALLIAFTVVPASYVFAVLLVWLIITASP